MKKFRVKRFVAVSLIVASIIALKPIRTNAEWRKDNKGWWYTEGNSWATGWRKIDSKWYYFGQDGYMEIGWLQDDNGKWYYLNNDGSMAHDTVIEGYKLGSDGSWINSNISSNYSTSELNSLGQQLLNNISIQNPSFTIEYTGNMNDAGNVFKDQMEKLKYTNPYEVYNISSYKLQMYSWAGSNSVKVTVECAYRMTADMAADLDSKAKSIVAEIAPGSMSQAQKERAIHDWIINNTRYDQSYTIYDPYNTLVKHTGVCEGYTLLAQKMFNIAGIKSMVVEGSSKGQSHAWNLVYINGKWRHVDLTWDDPVSSSDILRYDYYNLTDKEISEDHSWDTSKYPKTN